MKMDFPYNSLHDYLDTVLVDNASEQQIIVAKKLYWKAYNTALKRYRRKVLKYVSIALTKQEYQEINKKAKEQEITPYRYIKEILFSGKQTIFYHRDTSEIHQLIFTIINDIEELEDNNNIEENFKMNFLQKLKHTLNKLELHTEKLGRNDYKK